MPYRLVGTDCPNKSDMEVNQVEEVFRQERNAITVLEWSRRRTQYWETLSTDRK